MISRPQHAPFLAQLHALTLTILLAVETTEGVDGGTLYSRFPDLTPTEFGELVGHLTSAGLITRQGERYFRA